MNVRQFSELSLRDILIEGSADLAEHSDAYADDGFESDYGDDHFEEELVNYDDEMHISHSEETCLGDEVPTTTTQTIDEFQNEPSEGELRESENTQLHHRFKAEEANVDVVAMESSSSSQNLSPPKIDTPLEVAEVPLEVPKVPLEVTEDPHQGNNAIHPSSFRVRLVHPCVRKYVSRVSPVSALNLPLKNTSKRIAPPSRNHTGTPFHPVVDDASEHLRIQSRAIPVRGVQLGTRFDSRDDIVPKELNKIIIVSEGITDEPATRNAACQTADERRSGARPYSISSQKFRVDSETTATALRLGTDRFALMATYEKVHSSFLSDIIGNLLYISTV